VLPPPTLPKEIIQPERESQNKKKSVVRGANGSTSGHKNNVTSFKKTTPQKGKWAGNGERKLVPRGTRTAKKHNHPGFKKNGVLSKNQKPKRHENNLWRVILGEPGGRAGSRQTSAGVEEACWVPTHKKKKKSLHHSQGAQGRKRRMKNQGVRKR